MVVVATALLMLLIGGTRYPGLGSVVYEKNSLYHRIFVFQDGPLVTLQLGRVDPRLMQSQVDKRDLRRHMLEYTGMMFCGLLYSPQPRKALVLGLGGGVIPRELRHYFPECEIDVAEIDPEIPPVAERFFAFSTDEKLKVHVADGRMFIKKQLRSEPVAKYDIVILDAFNSDYIPFHLMTREFLQEVKAILSEDGVVVANVFYSNRLFDAEFKTFLDVFGRCEAFFGTDSTNAMLVSGGSKMPALTARQLGARAAELQDKHPFAFDLRTVAGKFRPGARPNPQAKVLTDDLAPVNWLREQEREAERPEVLHPSPEPPPAPPKR